MTKENQKHILIPIALAGITVLVFYILFRYLAFVLLPFFIGVLCAIWLQKPLAFLVKHTPFSKAVWSLFLIGGLTILLFGILIYSSTILYSRLFWLIEQAAKLVPLLSSRTTAIWERFSHCTQTLPPALVERLRSTPEQLAEQMISLATDWLTRLAALAIRTFPSLLIGIVVTVAACFFTTAEYSRITTFLLHHSSLHLQKVMIQTKQIFTHRIFSLIRGYGIVMGITFIELFFGLLILGIPYASTIALLIAAVDILPILGTGTVLLPWGLGALFLGNTKIGVSILVLYIFITIIRNFIEPKIIGKEMGLPPLVTLMAMYVGLKLFGFLGLWGVPILLILGIHLYKEGAFSAIKNSRL